ncbi:MULTISPECIES: hypothetical protein [Celeribacter]|uniref:Uncharacterized protein n=1 Tax=Celeribacter halophilus TaxID=576117 RepID=A0A1I3MVS4_9RHOB|nr:hypothetical protein [Celeribacter halophilus]MDO6456214.1 hypothetical protein [Celeribacter halophilus]MDO6722705.1 hypothetical protein [Celeribacter halophilus]PZX15541.1 hypothetical protein LX82_00172 [Celeribacter halophilus]SFJ01083.1 hypothetical protein SAMN04488138_101172 [Celeribacter halophilus]
MLQDKKNELDSEKQKKVLTRLVKELSEAKPEFYYKSTPEIAVLLKDQIEAGKSLNGEERHLMQRLSLRDIEVILSLH